MRLSRGCYDKYRRCPGWAGGGLFMARVMRCDGGHLDVKEPLSRWRFYRCATCGVCVLPPVTKWLDPTWWRWQVRSGDAFGRGMRVLVGVRPVRTRRPTPSERAAQRLDEYLRQLKATQEVGTISPKQFNELLIVLEEPARDVPDTRNGERS